jgi:hypothetical protein
MDTNEIRPKHAVQNVKTRPGEGRAFQICWNFSFLLAMRVSSATATRMRSASTAARMSAPAATRMVASTTSVGGSRSGRIVSARWHGSVGARWRIGSVAVVVRWGVISRRRPIHRSSCVGIAVCIVASVRRAINLIHLRRSNVARRVRPVCANPLWRSAGIGDVALCVPRSGRSGIGTRSVCVVGIERTLCTSGWWPVRRNLLLTIHRCSRISAGCSWAIVIRRRKAARVAACSRITAQRGRVHGMHRQMRSTCCGRSPCNYRAILNRARWCGNSSVRVRRTMIAGICWSSVHSVAHRSAAK